MDFFGGLSQNWTIFRGHWSFLKAIFNILTMTYCFEGQGTEWGIFLWVAKNFLIFFFFAVLEIPDIFFFFFFLGGGRGGGGER